MSAATTEAAIKRLEALFKDVQVQHEVETADDPAIHVMKVDKKNCHIHGHGDNGRRGSLGNILHARRDSYGPRRESMPALNVSPLRRNSSGLAQSPALVHPSAFPSTLRKDSTGSTGSLRRDSVNRRGSLGSTGSLNRRDSLGPPIIVLRRDSTGSALKEKGTTVNGNGLKSILRKESSVSTGSLLKESSGSTGNLARKDSLGIPTVVIRDPLGSARRDSIGRRRFSTDSLDAVRRNSWDPGRRGSSGSSGGWDDPIWEENIIDNKPVLRTDGDLNGSTGSNSGRPKFVAVTSLEDVQAVRCAEFHPLGKLYAVGSNSKTLRICSYPKLSDLREEHTTYQPTVLFKRTKHHKGSIYCMAWTPIGDLMATGSNDKTVKLMRFNVDTSNLEGQEVELTMHDGTVRDLCFLEDTSNKSSLLISGGAGDCKIYVTDCATGTPFQALSGHSGHVLTLYNWGGAMFVSGSQDKTVRFWDLRTRGCVNMVTPATAPGNRGSAVAGVCVDPSGRLLVSGHEDSSCVLFDIRGGRNVQCFKPHASDVRSIRFSPSAYYLLTAGYDNKLVLTDLQGDLTMPLPSVVVAQHQDKVISGRWHPTEFSFLSTSADKTATLWALPPV